MLRYFNYINISVKLIILVILRTSHLKFLMNMKMCSETELLTTEILTGKKGGLTGGHLMLLRFLAFSYKNDLSQIKYLMGCTN
jgi:hypothetical protein